MPERETVAMWKCAHGLGYIREEERGNLRESCCFDCEAEPVTFTHISPGEVVGRGWQPIETAPEDETVMLYCGGIYGERHTGYRDGEGWRQDHDSRPFPPSTPPFTHWMPLPAGPEAGE